MRKFKAAFSARRLIRKETEEKNEEEQGRPAVRVQKVCRGQRGRGPGHGQNVNTPGPGHRPASPDRGEENVFSRLSRPISFDREPAALQRARFTAAREVRRFSKDYPPCGDRLLPAER